MYCQVYLAILVMGLVDYMLSDYLWARAVILLGPTVVSALALHFLLSRSLASYAQSTSIPVVCLSCLRLGPLTLASFDWRTGGCIRTTADGGWELPCCSPPLVIFEKNH